MENLKYVFISICLIIFMADFSFSQFQVLSKVELSILYEPGLIEKPKKISLIGNDLGGEFRDYELELNNTVNSHVFYNVSPGIYQLLVYFDERPGFDSIKIAKYIMYIESDDENGALLEKVEVPNRIKVNQNRNLKLELFFESSSEVDGFWGKVEKKFNDYDYTLIRYSRNSESQNGNIVRIIPQNRNSASGICGDNTETTIPINAECTKEDGLITLKIEKMTIRNLGEKMIVPSSQAGVKHGLNNGKKWGSTEVSYEVIKPSNPDANCSNEKCKLNYNFDLVIKIERFVRDRDYINGYMQLYVPFIGNKDRFNLDNVKIKQCFLEAIQLHEQTHCQKWSDHLSQQIDYIKNTVNKICGYLSTDKCCDDDNEICVKKWKFAVNTIFNLLNTSLSKIINKTIGDAQEQETWKIDYDYFLDCINK